MKISKKDLSNHGLWQPVYGRFDKAIVNKRLEALAACGVDQAAYEATKAFVDKAFADFNGELAPKQYGFVFAIPTRITRDDDSDLSEAKHFVPIVEHITPDLAQVFLSEMPPCVLDEYYDKDDNVVGAIVFVPLFMNMVKDLKLKFLAYLKLRKIITLTARYISKQLQPEIIGLGATLPKITRFGKDFAPFNLQTTTGHGGTVYLIYKMFSDIIRHQPPQPRTVGIIGAGSIGASAAALLLDRYKGINVTIFDTRPKVLQQVVSSLNQKYDGRATAAKSNNQVLQDSSIIISAITSKIYLPEGFDMTGKIIIDDSQPGSFSQEDVVNHGGKIVWVVGKGLDPIYHRKTTFHFGDAGLQSPTDIWGCEAEVAILYHTKAYDKLIDRPVTPESALAIGTLMAQNNLDRSDWQAEGKFVDMDTP